MEKSKKQCKHNWEKTGRFIDNSYGELITFYNFTYERKCSICGEIKNTYLSDSESEEENKKRFCQHCEVSKELHIVSEDGPQAINCHIAKLYKQLETLTDKIETLTDKINSVTDKVYELEFK